MPRLKSVKKKKRCCALIFPDTLVLQNSLGESFLKFAFLARNRASANIDFVIFLVNGIVSSTDKNENR